MFNQFSKANNIFGWISFLIALIVYAITVEDTASYWDCGEFIAVSYKLEVPHPPGAPFFLLVGRLFSFLALGNLESVAYWINIVSVLSSAATILFLFWTITLFGRKILGLTHKDVPTQWQTMSLIAAGLVGALAYTFTDSFWFSAVEAEVYAMSSFFTAFVVWAILKWEHIDDEAASNRWLILIAYMMGLSIGVHLLNLVTIPALGLIYYFHKYKETTTRGILATLAISGAIIILVNNIIIPGLPTVAGKFEIFFVNAIGMPFNSGVIIFMVLFTGILIYSLYYTHQHRKAVANTALLCLTFILIGYASYGIILIRSNYDPPIDENNPEEVMSFVSYLKREQYGSRPLFYGPYYDANIQEQVEDGAIYVRGEDKYIISDYKIKNKYEEDRQTIFPRIYSGPHASRYQEIMGWSQNYKPNFFDNISYMISHQLGWMYGRYFMWNFSGRESDIQNSDWVSPLQAFRDTPTLLKENKGRNNYFMIPLLLGLIGLFFNYQKDSKSFSVIALLFFLTGAALVLYLNTPPVEPRERDYIYAGSYYAFAIWIGIAVLAMVDGLSKYIKNKQAVIAIATLIGLAAPAILAAENWDDHDRSNRYFSVDSAKNYLASCAPNAILFTGGDNDTFPLWYVQEVEEFRTDVRVIVLSYFNTDWYIDQMRKQMNDSPPLPISVDRDFYRQGGPNDYLPLTNQLQKPINVTDYLKMLREENQILRVPTRGGGLGGYNTIPSSQLSLQIDTNHVKSLGIIPPSQEENLVSRLNFRLKGRAMEKKDLMLLEILASNHWERPIYFNNTSLNGIGFDFTNNVVHEGNTYRLLPIEHNEPGGEAVNLDLMYTNITENFYFRELDNPDVYYNEDYRNFVLNHRASINILVRALISNGENERALEMINFSLNKMPAESVPYDMTSVTLAGFLLELDQQEKATEIADQVAYNANELLKYMNKHKISIGNELQKSIYYLRLLRDTFQQYGLEEKATEYTEMFTQRYQELRQRGMM